MLVECLLQHDGPHSSVLLPVLIQPLRNAAEKLSKLKEMIETTIDLKQAEQGEFIVKADFDEKLGGKWLIFESQLVDTDISFVLVCRIEGGTRQL